MFNIALNSEHTEMSKRATPLTPQGIGSPLVWAMMWKDVRARWECQGGRDTASPKWESWSEKLPRKRDAETASGRMTSHQSGWRPGDRERHSGVEGQHEPAPGIRKPLPCAGMGSGWGAGGPALPHLLLLKSGPLPSRAITGALQGSNET